MRTTKFKFSSLKASLIAGLTMALVIDYATRARLREENQHLREQGNQVALLAAQNVRSSNSIVEARRSLSIGSKQLLELLRLRGEMQALRWQTNELHETITQLRSGLPGQDSEIAESAPEAGSLGTLDGDSWVFGGYATPEAVVQSVAWGMSQGDFATLLARLTSEALQFLQPQLEGLSEGETAAMLTDEISQAEALLLNQETESTDWNANILISSNEQEDGTATQTDQQLTLKNVEGDRNLTTAPDE